ncbi:MAG: N-6 DNA methylase [Verrucomicrobiaceae bacterium]|nr:N-6 DNA methylase [Verrucomicrobiaceae bacterium]
MLDTDTKRRIDTARDILVGKVPDPKSQVEQITIALIYKFMDDMDAESEDLGGKRKFFTGDFARYGWAKLMRSGLGGHETLALYGEGITKMTENPGLPPLFRDIFKNAYLPYRDPETLKAFLKIIDEFTYDHSERLGDAFEYLLSVLGSQGDAGQFRTPRHIIDFIVQIVDPKKDETVLDPACGTAGFLISAYKHILRTNTDAKGHSRLTPDDRGRLARNFKGYDISPDMVRLSLVNLYLHGFTDPHIYEYDTLTSEERWNEFADVILANPPFMSPKGGIKPHRRFSIQAKRSEVLFVDYMAEHLTPGGRAGIIVPEGIIFQSQTAYIELRKMLVDTCLVAVISLPAGCFNPYSGVKTSILVLDKSLAKQAQTIAFFKVENDGFGLGAQRRAIEKNDLPQVQAELSAYLQALREGNTGARTLMSASATSAASPASTTSKATKGLTQPDAGPSSDGGQECPRSFTTGLIVPKEKIAANGDYNLSGERYREGAATNASFPKVRLGDACERIMDGTHFSPKSTEQGEFRYITAKNIKEWGLALDDVTHLTKADHDEIYRRCPVKKGDVLYIKDGATTGVATINPLDEEFSLLSSVAVLRGKAGVLDNRFLVAYLNSPIGKQHMLGMMSGVAISRLTLTKLNDAEIPLPPLEVQKEIVAEIEGYQKVINGARAVLDHYRPHIPIHPDWPMVRLADVCETITDGDHQPPPKANEGVPFVTITNIGDDHELDFTKTFFVPDSYYENLGSARKPQKGDILYSVTGSYGIAVMVRSDRRFCFQRHIAIIRPASELNNAYLHSLLSSPFMLQQAHAAATGVAQKTVSLNSLRNFQIPLPPLATQQAIVAEIEGEQALVAANRELITRFEQKIQATLARIWGDGGPDET